MNRNIKRVLLWTPRILSILLAIFLSLFALDIFVEDLDFQERIMALLIHLIPVYMIIIVLIIAWKREWVGAILYSALGVFYLVLTWGQPWIAYVFISGPLLLLGFLFFLSWKHKT